MLTTIYSDASVAENHRQKTTYKAGGGAWIRSGKGRIKLKRAFEIKSKQAVQIAETRIIYLASRLAWERWQPSRILVKTDCQVVVDRWEDGFSGRGRKHAFRQEIDRLRGWSGNHDVDIELRWVESHQSGNSTEAYLNRKVDYFAKEASQHNEI